MSTQSSPAGQSGPFSIVGLGTVVVDHHVIMDGLPEADAKAEVVADRHQVGGPVPTALVFLRRLGMRATFIGRWAADPFGEMIEEDLRAHDVGFARPPCGSGARSGFAHVWVERGTGKRSIAAYRGSHPVEPGHIEPGEIATHHALHLDGWSGPAAMRAAAAMRARGGMVFMDLGSPKPDLEELLRHVDFLNCPERLLHRLFDTRDIVAGARHLVAMGPKEVTVTSGEDGAHFVTAEQARHQPAFPVDAIDTNGAGDVFAGAMIFGTLRGWAPARRLRFACAASALKCRGLGNRTPLPDLADIESFLAGRMK